jgi:hypothetical protein
LSTVAIRREPKPLFGGQAKDDATDWGNYEHNIEFMSADFWRFLD